MAEDSKRYEYLNQLKSDQIQLAKENLELIKEEYNSIRAATDEQYRQFEAQKRINAEKKLTAARQEEITKLQAEGADISEDLTKELDEQEKLHVAIERQEKRHIVNLKKMRAITLSISKDTNLIWKYLMESDKAIKSTILSLGMSGVKAAEMRTSFENSAVQVTQLGGSLSDVQAIMQGYADETGRARALSAEMVISVERIGRGTGLGVEQATKLAAQFELMGLNAKSAMDYAQGVVETSELMGVNTTKVLKNISENFRRLQRYTFRQGVEGFAQMAVYAEKMHMDMSQALDSADIARSLEGAIDLAAQLQVMGGEFAKTDPFELLFLSRNDPAKFAEKVNMMTKGIVTFRKNTEGALESFISPADLDRLASVEKSLGMQSGELVNQSRRMAEIQRMRQRTAGMGLSADQQKLVEGLYTFDNKLDKFTVQIGGVATDITKLGDAQLKMLASEKESLDSRAKRALTFDETWKATIESLKSILLPALQGINAVLEKVRPKIEKWTTSIDKFGKETVPGMIKAFGIAMAVGTLIMRGLVPLVNRFMSASRMLGIGSRGGTTATNLSSKGRKTMRARSTRSLARGKGTMMAGAGVGAAALGVGAGIGAAAAGISLLADSMSKLDENQAETLKDIVITLGVSIGIMGLAAIGIAAFGATAAAAAPGLYAFGGAALMIGGAIGIAAAGIGVMGFGLGQLVESSKGAGPAMKGVGVGIMAIGAGLAIAGNPASITGLAAIAGVLGVVGLVAPTISKAATSIAGLSSLVELRGMKEDFDALAGVIGSMTRIGRGDRSGIAAIASLADKFNKPLQVEFADKNITMVADITMDIDGEKFYSSLSDYLPVMIIDDTQNARRGKRAFKTSN